MKRALQGLCYWFEQERIFWQRPTEDPLSGWSGSCCPTLRHILASSSLSQMEGFTKPGFFKIHRKTDVMYCDTTNVNLTEKLYWGRTSKFMCTVSCRPINSYTRDSPGRHAVAVHTLSLWNDFAGRKYEHATKSQHITSVVTKTRFLLYIHSGQAMYANGKNVTEQIYKYWDKSNEINVLLFCRTYPASHPSEYTTTTMTSKQIIKAGRVLKVGVVGNFALLSVLFGNIKADVTRHWKSLCTQKSCQTLGSCSTFNVGTVFTLAPFLLWRLHLPLPA